MQKQSMRLQRHTMLLLSLLGVLIAGYLVWSQYNEDSALCAQGGGCDIVRSSRYSEVAGVPVAAFGLLGYIVIGGILLLETRIPVLEENAALVLFAVTLIGFVYSAYLTYLELFVIFAICPYCVASAVIMTLLFGLSVARILTRLAQAEHE